MHSPHTHTETRVPCPAFPPLPAATACPPPPLLPPCSGYVPEEMRSTIINFFRIPLNLFVCLVLFNVRRAGGAAWLAGWLAGWAGGVRLGLGGGRACFGC